MAASPESAALSELYGTWADLFAANPGLSIEWSRYLYDGWGVVTAEPEGVTYRHAEFGGVRGIEAIPAAAREDREILYLHGGGFTSGSSASHRKLGGHIANAAGVRVFLADYDLFPEAAFPAGIIASQRRAYEGFLASGLEGSQIAVVGDSAGGASATLLTLQLRDEGRPLPAAVVVLSPWYDTEVGGDSMAENAAHDRLASTEGATALWAWLLGGADPAHPQVNALYADVSGLPPFFLSSGAHEALRDDATRFAARLREGGVEAELEVGDGQLHVFQFLAGNAPEADASIARIGEFLRTRLDA